MPDSQSREPGFESSLCYRFEVWAFPFSPRLCIYINMYLAIDSGGNMREWAFNCCVARMLPREVELMSEQVRQRVKSKAL